MSDTDRLRRLLLMLSSSYDNEVITAAKAVSSQLAKQGLDWHMLADRLTRSATAQPAPKPQQSRPQREPPADWDAWEACDIAEKLLELGAGRLSSWEIDFLSSMAFWHGPATDRQDAILHRIATKLGWTA